MFGEIWTTQGVVSRIVLDCIPETQKKMLHVPMNFWKGPTTDALIGSRGYVSTITESELDRIKQQGLSYNFKIDTPLVFQILKEVSWKKPW